MCTHLTNHAQKAVMDIADVAGLVFHGNADTARRSGAPTVAF